jgi:hypothetical protein
LTRDAAPDRPGPGAKQRIGTNRSGRSAAKRAGQCPAGPTKAANRAAADRARQRTGQDIAVGERGDAGTGRAADQRASPDGSNYPGRGGTGATPRGDASNGAGDSGSDAHQAAPIVSL